MRAVLLFLAIFVVFSFGKVIYVDSTATAGGNGQQSSPYNTINAAVSTLANGDQITIASGYYTVTDMTITANNIDINAPSGAYVTCDPMGNNAFSISSTTSVSIRNLNFYSCNIVNIILVTSSTGVLIQNCQFSNSSLSNAAVGLSTSSKVNIESSSFTSNSPTAVKIISSSNANITNSVFSRNPGSTTTGGGITVTTSGILSVSNSKFFSNGVAIRSNDGTINAYNNNFFSNYKPASNLTINCGTTTVSQSGNTFCGYLGGIVGCGTWTATYTAADSCGICNGNNANKDCNGVCFGSATGSCPQRKTIWVSAIGNGTKDGSTKDNAVATIQAGIDMASYGDTVKLIEGSYSGAGNYALDAKGKAITITSEWGQPERTIVTCNSNLDDIGIIVQTGESYDTIFKGITIDSCKNGALVTTATPTFQSMIFSRNTESGAYITTASPSFTDCDFTMNGNSAARSSSIYVTGNSAYYSMTKVKYCRISNNVNYRAGAVYIGGSAGVNMDSSFLIYNKLSVGTNGFSITADTSATIIVTNSSINTNITSGANAIYCPASVGSVSQSANSVCGTNGNTITCTQWGSATNLSPDNCGACGGGDKYRDCNSTCFGRSESDTLGGCCLYWQKDCNMICNGPSLEDSTGKCCVPPQTIDCNGICGGTYQKDKNNNCCEKTLIDSTNTCCTSGTIDCNGICNGTWVSDSASGCCPKSWQDYCGVCNGTNDSCQTCSKTCLNGGTCNNALQTCTCTGGYYGEQCESFSCPAGCNGGTCVAPNLCNCNGTAGTPPNCLISVDCGNITCRNNGSCVGSTGCDCTSANGYFGEDCTNFTCSSPCQNNGVCIGPGLCDCSASNGFYGNLCDQFTCPTGCSNGGVCGGPNTCSCSEGWTGPSCESVIESPKDSKSGFPLGAIIGIAVGGFVLLAIIVAVVIIALKRRGGGNNNIELNTK